MNVYFDGKCVLYIVFFLDGMCKMFGVILLCVFNFGMDVFELMEV